MPKVKTDKRNSDERHTELEKKPLPEAEGEKKTSGWGSGGKLFGSETTETTFQGAGFKDKDKALETIKLLEGRDISFQFQIINSMYHRAKVILKRTKDVEKVTNLTEAVETFDAWLDDYRSHSRAKENLGYLPLDTVEAYLPLAKHYEIDMTGDRNFLEVYKMADGDLKKLRVLKVDKEDEKSVTWDVHRNNHIRPIQAEMKDKYIPLYETDMVLRGLPTKEHTEMIMWGYSAEVTKVKKAIPIIEEKLK